FFSSRRRHTRWPRDWSSDVCSSDLLVKQAHLNTFGRGEPVIEEGSPGDSMFVMLRGAASVFVSKNGSKIQVATLGAGDCFGEMRSEERRVGKECRSGW